TVNAVVVLLLCAPAMALTAVQVAWLAGWLGASRRGRVLAALLFALGTQAFQFGTMLTKESLTALALAMAVRLALVGGAGHRAAAGALAGAAVLLTHSVVLLPLLLGFVVLARSGARAAAAGRVHGRRARAPGAPRAAAPGGAVARVRLSRRPGGLRARAQRAAVRAQDVRVGHGDGRAVQGGAARVDRPRHAAHGRRAARRERARSAGAAADARGADADAAPGAVLHPQRARAARGQPAHRASVAAARAGGAGVRALIACPSYP